MSEILGVLFAVFVGMMIIPRFAQYQQISNDNQIAVVTAQQQKQFNAAAATYIQQYSSQIQASATATNPAVITVAMLQAASVNLLPASFSATNPYGQTWQLQVLQPSAGNLQALAMSTGGTALPDKQASKIAAIVGAAGGLIPLNDSGTYSGGAANAYGASGGWTVSTANYQSVAGGHPAALLSFNNGQMVSPYLYRSAVSGQPQLNQMNTALDMTNNNINNVGALNASGQITSASVKVPAGNNLLVGSSAYSGDSTNSQIRQSGDLFVLDFNGNTRPTHASNFYADNQVYAGQNVTSGNSITGQQLFSHVNDYGLLLRDYNWNNNSQPQSAVGSAFLNDIYVRSANTWLSSAITPGGYIAMYDGYDTVGYNTNNSQKTWTIHAFDGRDLNDGCNGIGSGVSCNTCDLEGFVDGNQITVSQFNDGDSARLCNITFVVPPGHSYAIVSHPYPTYAHGQFHLRVYQH